MGCPADLFHGDPCTVYIERLIPTLVFIAALLAFRWYLTKIGVRLDKPRRSGWLAQPERKSSLTLTPEQRSRRSSSRDGGQELPPLAPSPLGASPDSFNSRRRVDTVSGESSASESPLPQRKGSATRSTSRLMDNPGTVTFDVGENAPEGEHV